MLHLKTEFHSWISLAYCWEHP